MAIAAAACELARYALTDGRLDDALRLARDGQDAARRARDHLREATALSLEATVIERRGDRRQADALFGQALRLLDDRKAAAKLAELCARYSEILEARGDRDHALIFMRLTVRNVRWRLAGPSPTTAAPWPKGQGSAGFDRLPRDGGSVGSGTLTMQGAQGLG